MRNLIFIFMIFLSGCAVKSIDENYSQILLEDSESQNYTIDKKWWTGYNEAYLNELIELALKNNINLAKSAIAINRALAQAGVLESDLVPSFNANLGANTSRDIRSNDTSWDRSYKSGISLSYEVDLWSKLKDARDAAIWEVEATRFDLDATRLALINSVVDSYFEILYLRESKRLYEMSLANYKELESIINAKVGFGKDEQISIEQVQSSILNAKNQILNNERNLNLAYQTLRLLLSVRPDFEFKFAGLLSEVEFMGVDLDVPVFALSNRPDLNAAQARIKEALLNVNVSQKNFYPSVTIGASLSASGDGVDDAFRFRILGGNVEINLPFLNYSRLKNNLKISEASFETMKLNYQETLITALNEVDTGYKNLVQDRALFQNHISQIKNYENISKIYKDKYDYGKSELRYYLEAKNNEINARNNLLSQRYKILQDEINIYKAMAGKISR